MLLALTLMGCGGPDIADERIDHAACAGIDLIDQDGRPVVGVENMLIVPEARAAILSAYDRRAVAAAIDEDAESLPTGGLYRLALDPRPKGQARVVRLAGPPVERPHGIALGGAPGARSLHIIERRYVREEKAWTLKPMLVEATLESDAAALRDSRSQAFPPDACAPNDLDWTPERGLFISNDHQRCEGLSRMMEDVLALRRGTLLRYAQGRFSQRREGLAYANGVAFDARHDDLLVAATRANAVHVLPLDTDRPEPASIRLDAAPDSLSFDEKGALYVAAHPSLFSYAAFRAGWFGREHAPSRVYRIDRETDGIARVSLIFDDPEGALLSGATGVAATGDLLLISGGYDDHILLCDLEAGRTAS